MSTQIMTIEAWKKRFAARFQELTGEEYLWARRAARWAAEDQADAHGSFGIAWEPPETAAEREVDAGAGHD